jgi:negative regulator of sigma E activity
MTDDLDDEKWNDMLRDLARDYNQPPMIVPRDAMWAAISAARQQRRPAIRIFLRRFAPLTMAAAAVLVLGIGLGRLSVRQRQQVAIKTPTTAATTVPEAYTIVTTQQLVQAQALLTAFSANDRDKKTDAQLATWARNILSNTRLLLDSPAGADPHRRQLLEDLELVLVQIAELSTDAAANDRAAIARTLDHAQVLPRLKAAIPPGQVGL